MDEQASILAIVLNGRGLEDDRDDSSDSNLTVVPDSPQATVLIRAVVVAFVIVVVMSFFVR